MNELPDLTELAPRIRKIGTICVGSALAAFGIFKCYPIFRLFTEPPIAAGIATALGLTCAYALIALDRYTDDYRSRLQPMDHFFFVLGTGAISVAIGALSIFLPLS